MASSFARDEKPCHPGPVLLSGVGIRIFCKARPCVCLWHTNVPQGRVALRATKETDCYVGPVGLLAMTYI